MLSERIEFMSELTDRCDKFAEIFFDGMYRRDGITPYIEHCKRVANCFDDEYKYCVGLLHDVIEESIERHHLTYQESVDMLTNAVGDLNIVCGVCELTHHDESYMDYIGRLSKYLDNVKIKIADIVDNLTDDPKPKQIVKYRKALMELI